MAKTLGIMLDCSRDAVMKPEKVKEFAKMISDMGYNMLQLYTEDTYEITGEPFFGYMRGRYSQEELKDIDAYCKSIGVELVPCIQVLAHLNQLVQWEEYKPMFDCNDILMVGDEKVYNLIEKMFQTVTTCFSSKRVNVGMDEAHMLGRGQYLEKNGYQKRVDILAAHLKRVKEIADKYGVTLMMWSDMFIRINNDGHYYGENIRIPKETIDSAPEGIELIYWDYYSKDKVRYDQMLRTHSDFKNPIAFAGGFWTWYGFAPNLRFALDATEAAMRSVDNFQVDTVFFTMWGDDGKECSFYAQLPVIFAASQMAKGNFDRENIAKQFEAIYGYSFAEFMNLELTNCLRDEESNTNNPCKYFLYNDPFIGRFDYTVSEDLPGCYKEAADVLKVSINGRAYDYLFEVQEKLSEVLAGKCDLGKRIRRAYELDDRNCLQQIAEEEIPELIHKMREFFDAFKRMWLKENKAFGLEVHEQRFGGLLYRMEGCANRLKSYLEGEISKIDELEEACLVPYGKEEGKLTKNNQWMKMVTTSVL